MNVRELRIDNYVYVDNKHRPEYKNTPLRVISIEDDSEEQRVRLQDKDGNTFCQFIYFIAPIPLTKDILLNCGFDIMSNGDGYYLELNVPNTSVTLNCTNLRLAVEIECVEIMEQPKYLHQLQNLYFALCGEELNVEL